MSMHRYPDSYLLLPTLCLSLAVHAGAVWYWAAEDEAQEDHAVPDSVELMMQIVRPVRSQPEPLAPQKAVVPVRTPSRPRPIPLHAARVPTRSRPASQVPAVQTPLPAVAEASLPLEPESMPVSIDRQALADHYRARLLRHIEAHKFYPAAARRQRLEGGVQVRLQLGCDGGVLQQVVEGPLLLQHAARQAVERAQPLPAPPAGLRCPQSLQYVMRYELFER